MDAAPLIPARHGVQQSLISLKAARSAAAHTLSILLAAAAIILLVRRLAGGLTVPLSAGMLLAVGIIAAGSALAVHLLARGDAGQASGWTRNLDLRLAALSLPIIAAAVSLSGSAISGLIVLWLIIVGSEVGLWQLRKIDKRRSGPVPSALTTPTLVRGVAGIDGTDSAPDSSAWLQETDSGDATQKLVYRCGADRRLSVEGWLRTNFISEQRTAIVHVAFCPAFEKVPTVEAELVDGPPCEIRPTLVLPWGVRWELKLDSPATTATTAVIEFIAAEATINDE